MRARALYTTAAIVAAIALVAGAIGVAGATSSKGAVGAAGATNSKVSVAAAPKGFKAFLVYLAEPTLAPGEHSSFTDAEHVTFFQQTIMGRTPDEVAEQEQLAKQYFHDRFGLDFGAGSSGLTFSAFVLNPHVNYRAYIVSGMAVPDTGWEVRDGGFQVVLTEATVLHGTYGGSDGIEVPAGASMVFGDYNIDVTAPGLSDILIHYQSHSPIIGRADGEISFNCDLIRTRWGSGAARGIALPNGSIRNVITFPPNL
jgi:hypothetical protein